MKYKILLIGKNKILIEDFYQHIEDLEMQCSSMRYRDIVSHITYFKPDALIFCMNKEEKARIDTVISLKEDLEKENVVLVLTGDLEECSAFQKNSGDMGDLILKKPITVRSIRDRVVQLLAERKEAEGADEETAEANAEKANTAEPKQQNEAANEVK